MKRRQPAEAEGSAPPAVFDPWTATEQEARSASGQPADGLSLLIGEAGSDAYTLWLTAQRVLSDAPRAMAEDGGPVVLASVAACLSVGLSVPSWLSVLFIRRVRSRTKGVCASWDVQEAFGKPHPKNHDTGRVAARQRRAARAYAEVMWRLLWDWDRTAAQVTTDAMQAMALTDERDFRRLFAEAASSHGTVTTIPQLRNAIRSRMDGRAKPAGPYQGPSMEMLDLQ